MIKTMFEPMFESMFGAYTEEPLEHCFGLRFNGINTYGQFAQRLIDPDGDIDIEWYQINCQLGSTRHIVTQTDVAAFGQREFILRWYTSGNLNLMIGSSSEISFSNMFFRPTGHYRLLYSGNTAQLYVDGMLAQTLTFVRGSIREPNAPTRIGARNGAGVFTEHFLGIIAWIKINNIYYPLADAGQAIQLPTPSGLGEELFRQSDIKLFGSVTANGDEYTFNLISNEPAVVEQQPTPLLHSTEYLLEFEIENYQSGNLAFNGSSFIGLSVNGDGFYRRIVNTGSITNRFQIVRNGSLTRLKIKNISIKSINSSNIATIFNAVPEQWEKIPCNIRPVPQTYNIYNMDGVDDFMRTTFRAIDPDGNNIIEFWSPSNKNNQTQTIISQAFSSTGTGREFDLLKNSSNQIRLLFCGTGYITLAEPTQWETSQLYELTIIGNQTTLINKRTNEIISTTTLVRGGTREPTAQTHIGARFWGNNRQDYFNGLIPHIRINEYYWRLDNKNQTVHLPSVDMLGEELITPSVLENPFQKGSQWTYLGNGRWQYIGDGSFNVLQFINPNTQPSAGFVQFEVESIDGLMMCLGSTLSVGTNQSDPRFRNTGWFRHVFINRSDISQNAAFRFQRQTENPASCIIKNISFRPLNNSNPLVMYNTVPERWQTIPFNIPETPKLYNVYEFDGVDDFIQLPNRAINVDDDILVDFWTPNSIEAGRQQVIVSQAVSTSQAIKEFEIFISAATGNLGVTVGGKTFAASNAGQYLPNRKYRFFYSGSTSIVTDLLTGDQLIRSFVRGDSREPDARTRIGCSSIGTSFFEGAIPDIRINDTYYQFSDKNQNVQLPVPSNFGQELITQSVLENPAFKGSQWNYLGNGRWQFDGDGTLNALSFIAKQNQPLAGFLEFEVESISGQMTCAQSGAVTRAFFNSVGRFRFFYTNINEVESTGASVEFKRRTGSVASCIIKNISFKPLNTVMPALMNNTVTEGWFSREVNPMPKSLQYAINFNGVNNFGIFDTPYRFESGSELEVCFKVDVLNTSRSVYGRIGDDQFSSRLQVLANGALNIRPTFSQGVSSTFITQAGLVSVGKIYVFRMTRSGTFYRFWLNGILVGEMTSNADTGVIEAVGRSGVVSTLFRGTIYYFKINNNYYPMDKIYQQDQLSNPINSNPLRLQNVVEEQWEEINPTIRPLV